MKAAIVGLLIGGCAALSQAPDTAARDAYKAAQTACQVYDLAPAEYHKPDADRACRSLRMVCDAPGDGGAGGAP